MTPTFLAWNKWLYRNLVHEDRGRGEFGDRKILHPVLYLYLKPLASGELDGCDPRM